MDPTEANMYALRRFRDWAYQQSYAFGTQIDALISDQNLGDASTSGGNSLQSILDKLANGIQTAANTASLSYKTYLDAQTSVAMMQAAQRAGVPVDQYMKIASAQNQTAAAISNPNSPIPSVLGVPIWVILGGVALLVLLRK